MLFFVKLAISPVILIVIDGGSTDGSKELIEEYSSHFAYWVSEPDKGIYNAMNKGIAVAKGEYLQFLNSGDWLSSENVLDAVCKLMGEYDIFYGDVNLVSAEGTSCVLKYPDVISMGFMYFGMICHQSTFIKRSLFAEMLYNERLKVVSDWEFFTKMLLRGKTFKHLPLIICNYDTSGISAADDLLKRERIPLIKELFPDALIEDYKRISEAESYLANTKLDKFIEMRRRHPIIGKLLTGCVLLMKEFER